MSTRRDDSPPDRARGDQAWIRIVVDYKEGRLSLEEAASQLRDALREVPGGINVACHHPLGVFSLKWRRWRVAHFLSHLQIPIVTPAAPNGPPDTLPGKYGEQLPITLAPASR